MTTVNALYQPKADERTNIVLPAGSAWWVIGAQWILQALDRL